MLLNFIVDHVWLAIGLWAIIYCFDYILTLKAARMYYAGVNKHFVFAGGYELNPVFQKDIAALRRFSFRFFLLLVLVGGLLLIVHSIGFPELFALCWGMLICVQLAIQLRHIRNLAVFHYARKSKGIAGRIEYQHWLSLRLSSVELFSFSVMFLFLFLLWGNFFVLGGAVSCLAVALRHLSDSSKETKKPSQTSDNDLP